MAKLIDTLHANIISYGANQATPYHVYRRGFIALTVLKTAQLKKDIKEIVLKYYPHYSNRDILKFLKK